MDYPHRIEQGGQHVVDSLHQARRGLVGMFEIEQQRHFHVDIDAGVVGQRLGRARGQRLLGVGGVEACLRTPSNQPMALVGIVAETLDVGVMPAAGSKTIGASIRSP